MSRIAFRIKIEPKSLQFSASRERIVQPKGKPAFIHHFKDREAEAHERAVATLCAPHRPSTPLLGPIGVTFTYVFERPQYLQTAKAAPGRIPKDSRPDLTNITKSFEDVLTRAGFWKDDGQLCDKRELKFYAARGESACIEVAIEPLYPDLHAQATLL